MISKTGLIHLSRGLATATINPQGAFLQRWHNGRDLLFFRTDMPNRSSHPCFPNFGPIYNNVTREKTGVCQVGGKTVNLPQHGFGKTLDWELTDDFTSPERVQLSLLNPQDGSRPDIMKMYPFPFRNDLIIGQIREQSLLYRLIFQNVGQDTAPVDFACHAYFPWVPGLTVHGLDGLEFDDTTLSWENLTRGQVHSPADFSEEKNRDWEISLRDGSKFRDNFEIRYPSGYSLFLKIFRETAHEIEVWTKPEIGPFICVEPVARGRGSLQKGTAIQVAPDAEAELAFELTLKEK